MSGRKRILVACGSSTATAMVVARKLTNELGKRGRVVTITQCRADEVESLADGHDLVVTTSVIAGTVDIPIVQTVSLLTGIGVERDIDKIMEYLK